MRLSLCSLALASFAGIRSVSAMDTISVTGSKFFTSSGDQFFIKGIAYQLSEYDPLIDGDQCRRDADLMKKVGANTIRVYHVDPNGNHDDCMKAFADNGIYLFLDIDTFNSQIEGKAPHWNQTQFDAFSKVLDTFHGYDNLAGVFVGNEVLTVPSDSPAAAYVKAAARDIKSYRDKKGYRKIPVGYSAADIAQLRPMLQDYLACGGNSSESIDFFGLNAYEWCGKNTFLSSGYKNLQADAVGYSVPIFFSETGCITVRPRTFDDQAAIFGSDMVDTWSGAIIYEWLQESNNYGLVNYAAGGPPPGVTDAPAPNGGFVRSGTPTPISPDFSNLMTAWSSAQPTGVKLNDYKSSAAKISTPVCPKSTAGASGWQIDGNPTIPAIGQTFNPTGSQQPSVTASASASATHDGASGAKELTGMSIGLGTVLLGFVLWL